jgi:hypothetical protein
VNPQTREKRSAPCFPVRAVLRARQPAHHDAIGLAETDNPAVAALRGHGYHAAEVEAVHGPLSQPEIPVLPSGTPLPWYGISRHRFPVSTGLLLISFLDKCFHLRRNTFTDLFYFSVLFPVLFREFPSRYSVSILPVGYDGGGVRQVGAPGRSPYLDRYTGDLRPGSAGMQECTATEGGHIFSTSGKIIDN